MMGRMGGEADAAIAQLGERQTEDLKVPGSIPGRGIFLFSNFFLEFTFSNDFPFTFYTVVS